jgi:SAM-dependent methyltransferase
MDPWLTALRDSYDTLAEKYTERIYGELAHKPFDRALLDEFAERVRGRGLVCDLGCGPGHVARYLHERGAEVCGVDLSPAMVARARAQNPGIVFSEGNMLELDIPDGAWSGVVAFYSIIHVPRSDAGRALREMHRALQPEGLCLVGFHLGQDSMHVDELWGEQVSLDCTFYRSEEMEDFLRAAGFAIERRDERDPYPDVEYPSRRGYVLARKPPAAGPV